MNLLKTNFQRKSSEDSFGLAKKVAGQCLTSPRDLQEQFKCPQLSKKLPLTIL